MIDKSVAERVIGAAESYSPTFCDLFVEENRTSTIRYLDRKVNSLHSGTDFGIGIRLVFGDKVRYGYTNSTDEKRLLAMVNHLSGNGNDQQVLSSPTLTFQPIANVHQTRYSLSEDEYYQEKIAYLQKVDQTCRRYEKIHQVDASVTQRLQKIAIFNSEGTFRQDERDYTRVRASVVAIDGTNRARGGQAPGLLKGWELAEEYDPENIGEIIANQALTVLRATSCPSGKMPVVIENGFGGVIFHEACGHLLETTSVEKKASAFFDKLGLQIAHPCVNAVDDGTIPNSWGSINMDDEGYPTQKTKLIENGKLIAFLSDRIGEIKTGHKRTGSGRRESYRYPPASRMRNTYIEPGTHSTDEIISSIEKGLYAKVMGGGSVTPGTGDFNFAVEEAYLIENGKIGKPVRGATLIGSGPKILPLISMVGNNLKLDAGMCGSVSGYIPVTVGQPTLKVDEILVGGVP